MVVGSTMRERLLLRVSATRFRASACGEEGYRGGAGAVSGEAASIEQLTTLAREQRASRAGRISDVFGCIRRYAQALRFVLLQVVVHPGRTLDIIEKE